jgi:WD40 repeat protein
MASSPTEVDESLPTVIEDDLPRNFGEYELLEQVARGGMGIVYKARQTSLDRIVAVKMLLFGPLASPELVKRFQAEATAAACLQHPNIVAIHQVGVHQGQQYFAMDFVEGESLARKLAAGPLTATRAATYLKTIAEAIHYAHERGILHRDLKPSNVLIDANDQPRVTDFGLARRLDRDSELTVTGQVLGSPNYMPPEQAAGRHGKMDRRSDVYSLGAMLYHLLTGRPPFVGEAVTDTLQQVLHAEAISPRLLHPNLPRDLETLCLKCLEKEPGKRYRTAQELADELGRFLSGEGIRARPISQPEKIRRWCVRKPAMAAAILLAGVLVVTLVAGSVSLILRSQREKEEIYRADMNLARLAWEENNLRRVRELLAETRKSPHRGFEWGYWQRQTHLADMSFDNLPELVIGVSFSSNGARVLGGFLNQTAKVWEIGSRRELLNLTPANLPDGVKGPVVFTPDGHLICGGASDGRIRLWDATTGREVRQFKGHNGAVESAVFSTDGSLLASGGADGTVMVWDARTGSKVAGWTAHGEMAWALAFSPDGQRLATASRDTTARVWDIGTGKELVRFGHPDQVTGLAYFPDGRRIVTGCRDQTAKIWDLERTEPVHALTHRGELQTLCVSPDGNKILTGCGDSTASLWDAGTGNLLREFKGHSADVSAVGFSPDGQRILTGSVDRTIKIWNLASPDSPTTLRGHTNAVWSVDFSPTGDRIVTGSWDATAMIWDAASGRELARFSSPQRIVTVRFSPDEKRIAIVGWHGMAKVCNGATGEEILGLVGHTNSINAVSFSPTGDRLATGANDRTAKIWSGRDGELLQTLQGHSAEVRSVAFSPDGRRLLTASMDGTARIWEAASGRELTRFEGHQGEVLSAAFSPDGRWVATSSDDRTVKIWDARTGRLLTTLVGHASQIMWVTFSPDGKRLATGSWDNSAKIWETRHWKEVLTLKGHSGPVLSVAFSPDGRSVVTGSYDRTARIWQAATREQIAKWEKESVILR